MRKLTSINFMEKMIKELIKHLSTLKSQIFQSIFYHLAFDKLYNLVMNEIY